eukprot:15439626-Alexandrium_andersonii.AAC.1
MRCCLRSPIELSLGMAWVDQAEHHSVHGGGSAALSALTYFWMQRSYNTAVDSITKGVCPVTAGGPMR